MLALVLGGAACVWQDVEAFQAFDIEPDAVVACNDMIAAWPGSLTAACSLHADKLQGWLDQRSANGLTPPSATYAKRGSALGFDETDFRFVGQTESGSSGLFALKVALIDLGADRAVLCGIPMDTTPHFFDAAEWRGAPQHWNAWLQALPLIGNRTRSMNGNTQTILGAPALEWLRMTGSLRVVRERCGSRGAKSF